jgi:hypothetical protein
VDVGRRTPGAEVKEGANATILTIRNRWTKAETNRGFRDTGQSATKEARLSSRTHTAWPASNSAPYLMNISLVTRTRLDRRRSSAPPGPAHARAPRRPLLTVGNGPIRGVADGAHGVGIEFIGGCDQSGGRQGLRVRQPVGAPIRSPNHQSS